MLEMKDAIFFKKKKRKREGEREKIEDFKKH